MAKKPTTTKKTKKPLTPKDKATAKKEPFVEIKSVEVDPTNVRIGSFELHWNHYFIEQLIASGYRGENDEAIIDQWFQDVCRHIVLETYEQDKAMSNVRFINRNVRDDGRSEIS